MTIPLDDATAILADPDAAAEHKDVALRVVMDAARRDLADTALEPERARELAARVLSEPGWSAQAKRLAGSTLSEAAPDAETAHDIGGVAGMVLLGPAGPLAPTFTDVESPELRSLTVAALARIER